MFSAFDLLMLHYCVRRVFFITNSVVITGRVWTQSRKEVCFTNIMYFYDYV